jgi:methylaspartate ammonia-lyase
MGTDEGIMIVNNVMNRTLALIHNRQDWYLWKQPQDH